MHIKNRGIVRGLFISACQKQLYESLKTSRFFYLLQYFVDHTTENIDNHILFHYVCSRLNYCNKGINILIYNMLKQGSMQQGSIWQYVRFEDVLLGIKGNTCDACMR